MGLKRKTISGLGWSSIAQAWKQITQFIVTAILARLLSPDDFGLVAMATVFTNLATIFADSGISGSLVQKQDCTERHYSSAFWLNIIVGLLLTIILILSAPLIAAFYKKPELKHILTVISFNFVLSSFTLIQSAILSKKLEFKKLAIRDISALFGSGLIGVGMAYSGFGVWSIVCQILSFTLFNAILLWGLSPWRPKFEFAKSDIKDIFHFSSHLTGSNIVNYFARNIDKLLIGKFLGAQALGYYSLAYKIMLYPLENITTVLTKVMFPVLSSIQDRIDKVRKTYLVIIKTISLITFPMMSCLFILTAEIIAVFLGDKWTPIIPILKIFCLTGAIQSIGSPIGIILFSQGKAELQFKLGILGSLSAAITILIGLNFGITGVAVFYSLGSVLIISYILNIVNKLIYLKNKEYLYNLKHSFYISIILLLALAILNKVISLPTFYKLITVSIIGFVIYISFILRVKIIRINNWKITTNILH